MGKMAQAMAALAPTQAAAQPVTLPVGYSQGLNLGAPLARPSSTFDAPFGPSRPPLPLPLDAPLDPDGQPAPRLWEYPVGYNLPRQPGDLKLVAYPQLRTFADLSHYARTCIRIRKREVADLDWDIVVDEQLVHEQGGDAFAAERAAFRAFWRRPDSDYDDFASWIAALMEDQLVLDAVALFPAPARSGRGRTGTGVAELQHIDAATIRPLLDARGGRPRPPAPAYEQYLWGLPRSEMLKAFPAGWLDPDNTAAKAARKGAYTANQLIYLVRDRRRHTPYGFSALEQGIVNVLIAMRRQEWLLSYFEEGSIPELFLVAPDTWKPEQLRDYEDQLNALGAAAVAEKHKIRLLPFGSDPKQLKEIPLESGLDVLLRDQICAAFDVTPGEAGFAPEQGLGGKGFADGQENVQYRKALLPDKRYWERIVNRISHDLLGMPEQLEFKFLGFDVKEDQLRQAQIDQIEIQMGKRSIDELRERDGMPAWNFPLTGAPFIVTREGITPLDPDVQAPTPPAAPGVQPGEPLPPGQSGQQQPAAGSENPHQPDDSPLTDLDAQSDKLAGGGADHEHGHEHGQADPDPLAQFVAARTAAHARQAEVKALGVYLSRRRWQPRRPFRAQYLAADEVAAASTSRTAYQALAKMAAELSDAHDLVGMLGDTLAPQLAQAVIRQDTAEGVKLLAGAYQDAYADGADYWNRTPAPTDQYARHLAEQQWRYLAQFGDDAQLLDDDQIEQRAKLYLNRGWQAWQAGLVRHAPAEVTRWRWDASATACDLCAARDGRVYDDADLPGYPGEGGYGDLCRGGGSCRCSLSPVAADTPADDDE